MSVRGADRDPPRYGARTEKSRLPDQRLPRSLRIRRSCVFREAFDQDVRFPGRYMVMWLREGPGANLRLGVVASKRSFRRAVDRARAKRLLREAYRLNRFRFRGDVDIVLLARRDLHGKNLRQAQEDLLTVARRAGVYRGHEEGRSTGGKVD